MAARLLAFHMSGGPPYGLRLQGGLNDSPFVIAKVSGRVYIICKNYFATAGLNDTVFTVFLPPNPDRLVTCTLDNVGTTLSYRTSNMIVINVTLLLVHFFTMSKFYVCFMSTCVYCMNCFFSSIMLCAMLSYLNTYACHVYSTINLLAYFTKSLTRSSRRKLSEDI